MPRALWSCPTRGCWQPQVGALGEECRGDEGKTGIVAGGCPSAKLLLVVLPMFVSGGHHEYGCEYMKSWDG